MASIFEKLGETAAQEIIERKLHIRMAEAIMANIETELYEVAGNLREHFEKEMGITFANNENHFTFAATCESDVKTAIAKELLIELKSWCGEK